MQQLHLIKRRWVHQSSYQPWLVAHSQSVDRHALPSPDLHTPYSTHARAPVAGPAIADGDLHNLNVGSILEVGARQLSILQRAWVGGVGGVHLPGSETNARL